MHPKPKHPRLIPFPTFPRHQRRINLEHDALKTGAKICAVDGGVPGGFRVVDVFAFGAVEFDGLDPGGVGQGGGKQGVGGAVEAGATAEIEFFVFFELGEM